MPFFSLFSWLVNVHQLGKKKARTNFLFITTYHRRQSLFYGLFNKPYCFQFDLEPLGNHFLFMRPQLQFETLFGFKPLKRVAAHLGRSRRARVELEDHN